MISRRSMLARSLASAAMLAAARFLPMPARAMRRRPEPPRVELGAPVYLGPDRRVTLTPNGRRIGVLMELPDKDGRVTIFVTRSHLSSERGAPALDGSVMRLVAQAELDDSQRV